MPPPRAIIVDMSASDDLDITCVEMLEGLIGEFRAEGIELTAAEVHQPVRDMALRSGLAGEFSRALVFPTVDAAVQHYLKLHPEEGSQKG